MTKTILSVATAMLALFTARAADAVVIDLGTLPVGEFSSPQQIADYLLTPLLDGSALPYIDIVDGVSVLRGTEFFSGADTILTRVDGGVFTLNSVDIGLIPGYRHAQAVSSPRAAIDLNGVATEAPQTIAFGSTFANVRWIDLNMLIGPYYAHIDVVPGIVPEPENWVMFVAGFGLVGLGLRRNGARLRAPTMPQAA